jgi:hypothetical protein
MSDRVAYSSKSRVEEYLQLLIIPSLYSSTMATTSYADLVDPDFHQVNLEIEDYLKFTRGYKLDSGKQSRPPLTVY